MMKFRIWIYYFKNAVLNILINRWIHLVSIGTISISLLLFAAFILFFVNVNNWMLGWGQSLSMSVYLKDGVGKDVKDEIESIIKGLPGAEITGYVSKEQAEADLIAALGEQAGLLDGITTNLLPASFEITFKNRKTDQTDPKSIKILLEQLEGVDEVQYSEQWLERFEGLMYILKVGGLIVGGLFSVAVLFIITNTIKLTIYSRRDEIEILKLVGATDWFVKMPFLIEGAIQGILSGFIALFVLFLVYSFFSLKTLHVFGLPVMNIVFLPYGYMSILFIFSLVLGLTGSFIAVGRFFRLIG
jgi:cell division transport system permease protein